MVDVSSQNNSVSINVSSGGNSASIKATPDMAQYYSEKSREWAISNRIVDNTDYSSKYYAEKSKESEAKAENYERSIVEKYNSFVEVSNQAETELQTLRDDSVSQINTVASSGISDIANKTSEAITEINETKETATSEINNVKNNAVTQLSKEAQEQLKNIESTGFYMRDDKLYFINSKGEEEEFKSGGGGAGAVMFDTKIADHILEGEQAKGWALQGTYVTKASYPDFYNTCLTQKEASRETEVTLGESTLTMYVNDNGHQFFNIADKAIVDTFYETYGIADFYGIDKENERVFLPRNKYFAITGEVPVAGNGMTLGLANGNANFGATLNTSGLFAAHTEIYGQEIGTPIGTTGATGSQTAIGVTTDPTKSGIEAQLTPNENKYLYYCVGNTEVTQAITNVVEITESENDSNPLGSSFYFNNIQPNAGWLKSSGQWNDGNVYTTFYNWLVEEKTTNTLRTDIKTTSEDYTDYDYVLNQDEMTFRLPLLNGSENIISDKYDTLTLGSSGTSYTAPANGTVYISITGKGVSGLTYIWLTNQTANVASKTDFNRNSTSTSVTQKCIIEVKKGDVYSVKYDMGTMSNIAFQFNYSVGNGDLYFKVANAVQNLELLDAGEVLEAVNDIIPNNSDAIAGYGLPDYENRIDVGTCQKSTVTFTAPTKGFMSINVWGYGGDAYYNINGVRIKTYKGTTAYWGMITDFIPVNKGDYIEVYSFYSTLQFADQKVYFYPMKGAK